MYKREKSLPYAPEDLPFLSRSSSLSSLSRCLPPPLSCKFFIKLKEIELSLRSVPFSRLYFCTHMHPRRHNTINPKMLEAMIRIHVTLEGPEEQNPAIARQSPSPALDGWYLPEPQSAHCAFEEMVPSVRPCPCGQVRQSAQGTLSGPAARARSWNCLPGHCEHVASFVAVPPVLVNPLPQDCQGVHGVSKSPVGISDPW